MKIPIIVKNSWVPKALSWVINAYAITLWPFIFIRDEGNDRTINHESIHIKQYSELLVVGFYVLYAWDWLHGLVKYRNKETAYYRIRFEQEAYDHDVDVNYLAKRKRFAWRRFKV